MKPTIKENHHPRNKNRSNYDLEALKEAVPELKSYLKPNRAGEDSVDFAKPEAVKLLNKAILKHYYGIDYWEFPDENLCPPIPGRADYIHHLSDLLAKSPQKPSDEAVKCLDIGTGSSLIYPILGVTEYNWNFVATDIDETSLQSAQKIIDHNASLHNKVELRLQTDPKHIFANIIKEDEKFDFTLCNPPFHASVEDAMKGTQRKVKNLTGIASDKPEQNFSGNVNELIYEGGEMNFITTMIEESRQFAKNCNWFTTLVSKQSHLKALVLFLKSHDAEQIRTIPMSTGNKSTRILAWSFLRV